MERLKPAKLGSLCFEPEEFLKEETTKHRSLGRVTLLVQTVDATPLWSFDLAIRFKQTEPLGCCLLLPTQDAFSLLL